MWGFDVYHLLSIYCTMDKLKSQLGCRHHIVPYLIFFNHLCVSPLIFISKERLFANVTVVTVSLYPTLGVVGFLWNSSNHVLHYIVPETGTLQSEFSLFPTVQISYSSFMYILSAIFLLTRCKGVWEQIAGRFQVKFHVLEIRVSSGVEWRDQNDNKSSWCFI